ncbi:importin subunit alpha-1-like [Synchiropus picturatus]
MSSGCSIRRNQFKNNGKDTSALRRRRLEVNVEIRKAKKDGDILKRRNVNSLLDQALPQTDHQCSLETIVQHVEGQDLVLQLQATQTVRKLLSREADPPVDAIIAAGLLPRLVSFLGLLHCPSLQFEAAWVLANITSGTTEQNWAAIEAGVIPALVHLVASPHAQVREQAVLALGNIGGDGPHCRDQVISHGGLLSLLALLTEPLFSTLATGFVRHVAWALSNICRHKNPALPLIAVQQLLPGLALLLHHGDDEVVAHVCKATSDLSDGSNERIELVVQSGLVPRLVQLLACGETCIVASALRALGNIVTGTDEQTQCVLNAGAMAAFPHLLHHEEPDIRKEAAWTLSNITAGKDSQIQAVISAGLVPLLVEVLRKGDLSTQKEAVWTITNMTSGGTVEQVSYLVHSNVLEPLLNMLTIDDTKIVLVVLNGLRNILQMACETGEVDKLRLWIETFGGSNKLKALLSHSAGAVVHASVSVLENLYSHEVSALRP